VTTVSPLLSSINSGEFSPRMEARVDFDRYPNAAKMCRNFLLLPQGGMTRRPGTRFVKEVKDSSKDTRLLPFQFSQDQSYIVEMGDAYARFYRRQARIEVANITASITNGTFGSNISSWTDLHTTTYVSGTTSGSDATAYTFTTHAIGTAAFDRNVVIAVSGGEATATGFTIASVTLDGVTMREIEQAAATGATTNDIAAGLYSLRVTEGTTATIVVTFSEAISWCRIDVFNVYGNEPISYADSEDNTITTDAVSTTVNVPVGGTIIAVAVGADATVAPTGTTWVGATERTDTNTETVFRSSCASLDLAAGETGRTISATFGGDADDAGVLVVATFGSARTSHDSTNLRLQFDETEAGDATATQAVTITETSTEHVLSFRIYGDGGGVVNFRVGTTPGGNDVLEDVPCGVGYHAIGFTPGAATVYVQFHSKNSPVRTMGVDTIAFLDNVPMELVTPYASTELAEIRFFQAADVMFLLHPDYAPRRLERRGHKTWSLVEAFFEDGPYGDVNPGVDLAAAQLVKNPFFEAGQKDWTPVTVNASTVESEPGESRIKLTVDTADDSYIRQNVTSNAVGQEHVVHYLISGKRTASASASFTIGSTAGGTDYLNDADVDFGWVSTAFTPTGSALNVQTGSTATAASPIYVQAVLIYSAASHLMRVSATTGSVTLTAVGHAPFASTDVGRIVRLEWPGNEPGYGVITDYTDATRVTLLVLRRMAYADVCTEKWQMGAWSTTTGYPYVMGFHDGRSVLGRTDTEPQSIWFSQSDDLQNMRLDSWVEGAAEVEDDDAIAIGLNSLRIDPIHWFSAQKELVVGTAGSQWVITSEGAAVTPSDIKAVVHSATPSASVQPAFSNQIALFLDRSQRELYEIGFSFDDQAFVTTLVTILADHIFRSMGTELAYQRLPHSIVWAERADGRAATLSYNRQHEILGWGQQIFGGAFSSGAAVLESIAVIPGADDSSQVLDSDERDEVWFIVKRTINGATERYIEFLEKVFEGPLREDYSTEEAWRDQVITEMVDAFYVDCGITVTQASSVTVSGLSHLEGQTVTVLANGRVHRDVVVSSGAITLDYAVTKAQVGLPYTSRYESLKIAVGAQAGTAVNKVKAVTGVGAVILDSGAFKATSVDYDSFSGRRQHDLQDISPRRDETMASNTAQPLVSGEVSVSTETHYPPDARVYIESDLPLPLTILALIPEIKATDARYTT
jgi:hypothetical protein